MRRVWQNKFSVSCWRSRWNGRRQVRNVNVLIINMFFSFEEGARRALKRRRVTFCRSLWEVKTKKDEKRKRRKGFLEGCFLFSSPLRCWFLIIVDHRKFFWSKFGRILCLENSVGFELLKF